MSWLEFLSTEEDDDRDESVDRIAILTREKWRGSFRRQFKGDNRDVDEFTDAEAFLKRIPVSDFAMIIRPREQAPTREELRRWIDGVKQFDVPLLICDHSLMASDALRWGADYFVMADKWVDPVTGLRRGDKIGPMVNFRIIEDVLKDVLEGGETGEDIDALIQEKEEFYDYVAEHEMFDSRSNETAQTDKEVGFLTEQLRENSAETLLDVGCGNGRLSIPLSKQGFDVTGIDISSELLKEAKDKADRAGAEVTFREDNALNMDVENASFDAVILMWHVICELRDHQEDLLREVYRVLKPDGVLIFDFPDRSGHMDVDDDGYYENEVNNFKTYVGWVPDRYDIIQRLKALGFAHIRYERVDWGVEKFAITATKV